MRFLNTKLLQLCALVMAIVGHVSATGGGRRSAATNYGSSNVNYGAGGTSSGTFGGGSSVNYGGSSIFTSTGFSRTATSRYGSEVYGDNEAPRPYNFDYQSADEQGNTHYHREEADGSGTVRGSYGYNDVQGLYRVVDYIADANGYRASIRTNEPGTDGKESPADVQMSVDLPPFGLQDRYSPFGGARGGGAGGYGCSASNCYETSSQKPAEEKDTYTNT